MKYFISTLAIAGIVTGTFAEPIVAQSAAKPAGATRLEISQGKARYKVAERFVGVETGNDATGTTEAVTGVNKISTRSDNLDLQINLAASPTVPASNYTGTLRIQARAL